MKYASHQTFQPAYIIYILSVIFGNVNATKFRIAESRSQCTFKHTASTIH